MSKITQQTIKRCSLTLGQFDSQTVDLLVTLFHHQDACLSLTSSPNQLKEKFENLLTTKRDADETYNDTQLTRIELAVMLQFKVKYLGGTLSGATDPNASKPTAPPSIENQLNQAYAFLLAYVDDRLSAKEHLAALKFLSRIQGPVQNLFDIYEKLSPSFAEFFAILLSYDYLAKELVAVDKTIRDFQLFVKRYEDFLVAFNKSYRPLPEPSSENVQLDPIVNQDDSYQIASYVTQLLSPHRQHGTPSAVVEQPRKVSVRQPVSPPSNPTSNVRHKGLCVIINIQVFTTADAPKRAGSDKDVDVIQVVFKKLGFTVLDCRFDFKKTDLDRALDYIDDKARFGNFECLVIFIMSHGYLHKFVTADSQQVIIRDVIRRYSDASAATIWARKPRLFFIQACRGSSPDNTPYSDRDEVKQSDLSPQMLVAYSCSAKEASKRSPSTGSFFIQFLCMNLLRYGHEFHIQKVLSLTADFVTERDKYVREQNGKDIALQRPEFLAPNFSPSFRFASNCLDRNFTSCTEKQRISLNTSMTIWNDLFDIMTVRARSSCK